MLIPVAFEVWGYSAKSSGAFQTVGALKGYGLLDDEGSNEDRRVMLTERARRYFLDERDDVRTNMLEGFALAPPLFRALWEADGWSKGVPADTVARSHLKLERGLNDQSARSLLSIFKENIQFAGLKAGDASDSGKDIEESPSRPMTASGSFWSRPAPDAPSPPPPPTAPQQTKPIVFDMESVTVSTKVENEEDLRKLIADLERLAPLMPKKE